MKEKWQLQAEHRERVRRALPIWWVDRDGKIVARGLPYEEARRLYIALAPGSKEVGYGRDRTTDIPWRGMFKLALVP